MQYFRNESIVFGLALCALALNILCAGVLWHHTTGQMYHFELVGVFAFIIIAMGALFALLIGSSGRFLLMHLRDLLASRNWSLQVLTSPTPWLTWLLRLHFAFTTGLVFATVRGL